MGNLFKFRILENVVFISMFILELILSIGLILYVVKILIDFYDNYKEINTLIKYLITDALSMFILLEIIKSINDFIYHQRIRISLMLDVSIIILLRELVLGIYQHIISENFSIILTIIIFVLVIARIFAIKYSPNMFKIKQEM